MCDLTVLLLNESRQELAPVTGVFVVGGFPETPDGWKLTMIFIEQNPKALSDLGSDQSNSKLTISLVDLGMALSSEADGWTLFVSDIC